MENSMDALEEILTLLSEQDVAVLATVAQDRPHCSLMRYAMAPDGTICLATLRGTRKWSNLLANPLASLLVSEAGSSLARTKRAVTVSARFQPFVDPAEEKKAASFLRAQLLDRGAPDVAALLEDPGPEGGAVIRLKPLAYQLQRGVRASLFIDMERAHE